MVFDIIFDGGYSPKNGAYGSYIIFRGDSMVAVSLRESLPSAGTGNQAEYSALFLALSRLQKIAPAGSKVKIRGDSKLVINQLTGDFATRNKRLKELRDWCRTRLSRYDWDATWWPRENSVRYFKH